MEIAVEIEDTKTEDVGDHIKQEREAHKLVARAPPTPPPVLRKRRSDEGLDAIATTKLMKTHKLDRNRRPLSLRRNRPLCRTPLRS